MHIPSPSHASLNISLQANELAVHMHIPVVHAGSVLPVLGGADCEEAAHLAEAELAEGFRCRERSVETNFECYVRRAQALDYEIAWVDLLEIDGVAPYSYSEVRLRVRVRSRPTPTRRSG